MRVVFAHDHIFRKDTQGNFYTAGSFNNQVWNRYLKYFDEIIVNARLEKKKIDVNNTYNNFDLPNVYFNPVPSLSGPIKQFSKKAAASKVIRKSLSSSDALIARLPSETGNLAIQIARELGKPYVVEVVACVWDALWNHGSLQAKLYAPISMLKMKKMVKKSTNTVYVTNCFLQNRYPNNSYTENISNVEIEKVQFSSLTTRLTRYKNNQRLYKIGMIGSLKNKIKGLDVALRALEILKNNKIEFEFQVLGDGDQESWKNIARELGIEKKVKFCGVLPGGEPVLSWLDDIDIYIQPSFQEGLPRAVIEAMSRGCPVVGSNAGGIPELIDEDCIHASGDSRELSKILIELMGDIKKSKYIAERNIYEAKKYQKDVLDEKRDRFWSNFLKEIDN